MLEVEALWVPLLVSAAAVFVASALAWTVMPHHRPDFAPADDEDALMDAIRKCAPKPGMYYFPYADHKSEHTKEYRQKVEAGPVGIIRVRDPKSALNMPGAMIKSFVYNLVVATLVAYVAGGALGPNAAFWDVFGTVGPVTFLAYALCSVHESIWMGLPRSAAIKQGIDGFAYALITAGVFAWLWPVA